MIFSLKMVSFSVMKENKKFFFRTHCTAVITVLLLLL